MEKRSRKEVEGLMKKLDVVGGRANKTSMNTLYQDLKNIQKLMEERNSYARENK
ncbi:MAG: hypothetical protein KJ559_02230 [Nanoarchaeota archaeon]|nr:hypothetical protein [Nanoarchaeota archaeon]